MTQEVISDFLIKFGFDAKTVESGLKKVNKLLDQYEKRIKNMSVGLKGGVGSATQSGLGATGKQDAHVKSMQKQLDLQERLNGKTEAYLQTIRVRKAIEQGLTNPSRIRQELNAAKSAADYQKIRTRLTTDMSVQQSALNKKLKEQNYLMQRAGQSSKQLVGNYISAFAAIGVLSNVTTIGQDFESINATFKAVSENAQVAGENLQFVRDETMRLGLGYKEAAKGFSQMLASNQGQLQLKDLKELFIGVSEAGTLLGLSTDDQAGSLRALQQMLSKTKVSSEELRLQLGK